MCLRCVVVSVVDVVDGVAGLSVLLKMFSADCDRVIFDDVLITFSADLERP